MQIIYHLKASELNERFLESIRTLFQDQMIEISISDTGLHGPEECSPRKAGVLKGRIRMADDFNAPLADFADYET